MALISDGKNFTTLCQFIVARESALLRMRVGEVCRPLSIMLRSLMLPHNVQDALRIMNSRIS
jgi:hypothetical protein